MNLDHNAKTRILDDLEDLKDKLGSVQSFTYKEAVAHMEDEDLKQAYNMLGHAQIAIDNAVTAIENYKNNKRQQHDIL